MKTNSAAVFVKLWNPFAGEYVNVKGIPHYSERDHTKARLAPYSGAKGSITIDAYMDMKPIHRIRATLGNVV